MMPAMTPGHRLWIEILRQSSDLDDMSAEAIRAVLHERGFPDNIIDEYLEARDG